MFKWLIVHAKELSIGLTVVILSILVPIVMYLAGLLTLGYGLWRLFHMGQSNGRRMDKVERERQPDNRSEGHMLFNTIKVRSPTNRVTGELRAKPDGLLNGLSSFFGGFFFASKINLEYRIPSDELTNAALKCKEQIDEERRDVKIITQALVEFSAEGADLTAQSQSMTRGLQAEVNTEHPVLTESRSKDECHQLLMELHELMENYPQCGFEDAPCIESIESYAEERGAHHATLIVIAMILLPNLSSLLNEAKTVSNLRMKA